MQKALDIVKIIGFKNDEIVASIYGKNVAFPSLNDLRKTVKPLPIIKAFGILREIEKIDFRLGESEEEVRTLVRKSLVTRERNIDRIKNSSPKNSLLKRDSISARLCFSAKININNPLFKKKFLSKNAVDCVVLSVDVRRSTDLMLGFENAKIFSEFLNELIDSFFATIKKNFGIYDKFTGDGFLAFFPLFYSGSDAMAYAINCARCCIGIFDSVFEKYRDFYNQNSDSDGTPIQHGLGCGIDFGEVYPSGRNVEYTFVGSPVVYACRLSMAPAGRIYLTKNAWEKINVNEKYSPYYDWTEEKIKIKHQGEMDVYSIVPKDEWENLELEKPSRKLWLSKNWQEI